MSKIALLPTGNCHTRHKIARVHERVKMFYIENDISATAWCKLKVAHLMFYVTHRGAFVTEILFAF